MKPGTAVQLNTYAMSPLKNQNENSIHHSELGHCGTDHCTLWWLRKAQRRLMGLPPPLFHGMVSPTFRGVFDPQLISSGNTHTEITECLAHYNQVDSEDRPSQGDHACHMYWG